ncbi:hypothetical protein D3C86_2252930 [compost metagenome]
MAGERDEGLELELALEGADRLDDVGLDLGRMAAGLQQRQHQGGELVAHGNAGEVDARLL